MTPLDKLLEGVSRRFGLAPRPSWAIEAERATSELSTGLDCAPEEVVRRAESDLGMLHDIAGRLTICETYFFRHNDHFALIRSRLSKRSGQRPARILSLGCATGEEPYSVAITSLELFGNLALREVEIVGCDLSSRAIEVARTGIYSLWSFRETPESLRARHFVPAGNGHWRLLDELRSLVRLESVPLEDFLATELDETADVVLFRNVGIYMEPDALARVYASIARVLRPGGMLLLAPADPRPPKALFATIDPRGVLERRDAPARDVAGRETGERDRSSGPGPRPKKSGRFLRDLRGTLAPASVPGVAENDFPPAAAVAGAGPSGSTSHLCRGKEALEAGSPQAAVEDLRRFVYLEPESAVGRFWLALALLETGEREKSSRQLASLVRTLEAEPPDALVADEGVRAAELLAAVRETMQELA